MKKVYDLRGKQTKIARLLRFDNDAFIHLFAYRAFVFLAVIYGIVLLGSIVYGPLIQYVKLFTMLAWILFIPLVFALMQVAALVGSKGLAFGKFDSAYRATRIKKTGRLQVTALWILPYLATAAWIICFFAMMRWWP